MAPAVLYPVLSSHDFAIEHRDTSNNTNLEEVTKATVGANFPRKNLIAIVVASMYGIHYLNEAELRRAQRQKECDRVVRNNFAFILTNTRRRARRERQGYCSEFGNDRRRKPREYLMIAAQLECLEVREE